MSFPTKHRLASVAAVFALSVTAWFAGVPAAAAASSSGGNCVQAAPHVGQLSAPAVCFTRFDDAIAYATGGAVRISGAATRLVSAAELAPAIALGSSPISIMYTDTSFGGSSYTWVGTTCTSTNSYADPSMPSGWNDQVESVRTYQNCKNDFYQNASYGGTVVNVAANTNQSSLGVLNDAASSEKWHV